MSLQLLHVFILLKFKLDYEVSKSVVLDMVYQSDQFQYLYMVEPGNENERTLDFFTFPPEDQGWIHVSTSNYTREEIYRHQVLIGNRSILLNITCA